MTSRFARCPDCNHRLPGHAMTCAVFKSPLSVQCHRDTGERLVGADRMSPAEVGRVAAAIAISHEQEFARPKLVGHNRGCDGTCGAIAGCAPQWEPGEIEGMKPAAPMVHFTDTVRPAEMSKGSAKKMDAGKAPVTAGFLNYFAHAIVAVAYVSEYGDRKYVPPGGDHYSLKWLEVQDGERRFSDADGRHRLKITMEGDYDYESQLAHLAHKAWNAMAELEYAVRHRGVEIRIGNEIKDGAPVPGTFKKVGL